MQGLSKTVKLPIRYGSKSAYAIETPCLLSTLRSLPGIWGHLVFVSPKLTQFDRLKDLGGTHAICGIARLIMCLAEVPFFFLSGPLIRRIGVRGVIALAQVAYLTRFVYYSVSCRVLSHGFHFMGRQEAGRRRGEMNLRQL